MIAVVSASSGVVYGQKECISANNCTSNSEIIIPFDKDIAAVNQEESKEEQHKEQEEEQNDNQEDNPLVLPFP